MTFKVSDRVRETTSTGGTGPLSLGGAFPGFTTFSAAIGDGNTTFYTISNSTDNTWEVGAGTYSATGNVLSRDIVFTSSNSNALVNFATGPKDIFCDLPAERAVYNNVDGSLVYDPAGTALIYSIALGG
jgi:hypothetical protein